MASCQGYTIDTWAGLFEAGSRQPSVSVTFELRYESLKSRFSLILFAYNLMIGYSKKLEKVIFLRKRICIQRKRNPVQNYNPGLALPGIRKTGPWTLAVRYCEAYYKVEGVM